MGPTRAVVPAGRGTLTAVAPAVQQPSPLPRFRGDLIIEPRSGGTFMVRSPSKPQGFLLYDLELGLARLLDGARTAPEVIEQARRMGIPATPESLTRFLRQLWQYGFLETPQAAPVQYRTVSNPESFSDRDVVMRLWGENKPDEALSYLEMLIGRDPEDEGLVQLQTMLRAQYEQERRHAATTGQASAPAPVTITRSDGAAEQERGEALLREAVEGEPDAARRRSGRTQRRRVVVLLAVVASAALSAVVPVPITITEPCAVYPARRAVLRGTGAIVERVAVSESQLVRTGDLLVQLSDLEARKRLESVEAERTRALASLELTQKGARPEEIDRARKVLQARQREAAVSARALGRKRALFAQQMVPRDELDAAEADAVARQGAAAEAAAQLKLLQAGPSSQELARLEADLKAIDSRLELAKKALDDARVVSPMDGRVATPRIEERVGSVAQAGAPLVEVIDTSKMRVEIWVPQARLDVLEKGLPVVVKVPNLPEQRFTGTVEFVSLVVEQRGEPPSEFVRVDTTVDNPGDLLRPNLTGFAEIRAGRTTIAGWVFDRLTRWFRFRFG